MDCPRCGAENHAEETFCNFCGWNFQSDWSICSTCNRTVKDQQECRACPETDLDDWYHLAENSI